MARKYTRHREHCQSTVRATIHFGNQTITLVGTHGFEWSIVKEGPNKIIITTFENREKAREEFSKFK